VKLVGTDTDAIIANTELLLTDQEEYSRMSQSISPYGDGKAAERIVQNLLDRLDGS